ncbi:SAM-dependent methyltransferase [Microbacterium sp. GXS0129]|uniref:class I SAM-dependent methyltransferase n=1 Tax=Microbacterium sp. GXS0129 TaxID=3377836 RepID=UPI00383BA7AB
MEMSELRALLTPEGLALLDATGGIVTSDDALRAVSRLRAAGHGPELVSAVVTQARLRTRAAAKFGPFAERMLFTRAGLEQATRMPVAARHAGRFRAAGLTSVADLGCGIGGDSLAFAGADLRVLAVDADEVTAAIAAYNLAIFGDDVRVQHARAEETDLGDVEAAWLDPARRTAGHSETTRVGAHEYTPSLPWVYELAERMPLGVKLGPAHDRAEIPDGAEAQWVSDGGSVVELALWFGALARPGIGRSALVMRGDESHELSASADTEDEPVRPLGAFLHEPDGAVIRARLIGEVARSLDAGMLSPAIAYVTGDAALTSPFVQSFRVREELPTDPKQLARALKARDIGTLEIKKRGVDVDPAALRRKLKLTGSESATLFLTRRGDTRVAILADRV